jgi:hypothetical protein
MPDGGSLTLGARNLLPAERPDRLPPGDYVSVFVQDSGTGMPAGVLARATDAFFTTKAPGKGTGLGLSMVQAFAERAGGCLRIDSHPGSGTCVEIILPRACVSDMIADRPDDTDAAHAPWPQRTILLVDQDDQLRQIMAGYLRALGYGVTEAPNAETASCWPNRSRPWTFCWPTSPRARPWRSGCVPNGCICRCGSRPGRVSKPVSARRPCCGSRSMAWTWQGRSAIGWSRSCQILRRIRTG